MNVTRSAGAIADAGPGHPSTALGYRPSRHLPRAQQHCRHRARPAIRPRNRSGCLAAFRLAGLGPCFDGSLPVERRRIGVSARTDAGCPGQLTSDKLTIPSPRPSPIRWARCCSVPPRVHSALSTLFHRRRSSAGETAHNCEHSCKDLMVRRKEENLRKFRITTHLRLECSLRFDPNELSATLFICGSQFRD
jgi:hypothetical protein